VTQMPLFLPLVLGAFGAAVGSFLNVVIYRLPREDLSVAKPRRSFCPHCRRTIPWYENVPVLSWLLLGGRCRGCKHEIPVRYLVVEVLTATLFAALGYSFAQRLHGAPGEWLALAGGLLLAAACVAVTWIDHDWKIIPDEITLPGIAIGVLLSAASPTLQGASRVGRALLAHPGLDPHVASALSAVIGAAAGAVSVFLIGVLGKLVFRKEAMGLGDVKYMGMVGAFLGCDGVLLVFFLACVAGAIGGIAQRLFTGDRYIAFGPYLSLGVLLVLFFRDPILQFLLVTWPETAAGWMGRS